MIAFQPNGEALSAICVREGAVVGYATEAPYLYSGRLGPLAHGDAAGTWVALHLLDHYPGEQPTIEAWLDAHRARPWVIRRA